MIGLVARGLLWSPVRAMSAVAGLALGGAPLLAGVLEGRVPTVQDLAGAAAGLVALGLAVRLGALARAADARALEALGLSRRAGTAWTATEAGVLILAGALTGALAGLALG